MLTTPDFARSAARAARPIALALALAAAIALPGLSGTARAQDQVQQYEAWSFACSAETGGQECVIFQELLDPANNQPVARLTVIKLPSAAQPVLVATTPLGVLLQPGLKIFIDQQEIGSMPLQVCIQPGCRSEVEMPAELLDRFKFGVSGKLQLVRPNGQQLQVPFSLKGFTAALAALP